MQATITQKGISSPKREVTCQSQSKQVQVLRTADLSDKHEAGENAHRPIMADLMSPRLGA
jgi:hypothetical protein